MNETMRGRPLRTIRLGVWLLLFVLCWSDRSVAYLRGTDLDQLLGKCGTKYTGLILNSYKVSQHITDSQLLQFGRYERLEVGRRYIGFLKYASDAESVYRELLSDPNPINAEAVAQVPKASVLELIRCNGIVPGLVAEVTWIVSGPEVIVPSEALLQVPAGVRVDARDGTAYYLRASDLSAYLRDFGKAM